MTLWDRVEGLLEMICCGWFAGIHSSPPCNTFSAILFRTPGPKPVRNRSNLWGLPGLQGKDLLRCEVGSWLARVAMAAVALVAMCGGNSSLEHPKDAEREPFPSLWITEESRDMETARHPGRKLPFVRRDLDQCMFSAVKQKPSTFSLNCVNSAKLCRLCTHTTHAGESLGGKDPQDPKVFKTSKYKEFPQPLCRKLAKVHLDTMLLDKAERPFQRQRKLPAAEQLRRHYPQAVIERAKSVEELRILGRLPCQACPSPFAHLRALRIGETVVAQVFSLIGLLAVATC